MTEPTSEEQIERWMQDHVGAADLYTDVAAATATHRAEHDCDAFETGGGMLLGVLARALAPGRVLEIGTALGYSTLWLAHGTGPGGVVHTIERDPVHAELARAHLRGRAATAVDVLVGNDIDVLTTLEPGYDLVFYDAAVPTLAHLDHFDRLLTGDGAILTSNLFLGRYVPDLPGLEEGGRYRESLFGPRWLTTFVNGKALSVRA